MKTCRKCLLIKDKILFDKREQERSSCVCKACISLINKDYRKRNPNKLKEYNKLRHIKEREKNLEYQRTYRKNNKEVLAKKDSERKKKAMLENPEKIREYKRKSSKKNKVKTYQKNRTKLKEDINYKLSTILRQRINKALTGNYKSGSAVKDLGCCISEFKIYLESKFQVGMTWENYGRYGWHIDHIIPLSYYNLSIREQFLKACHYTNLQPLWALENLQKGNRMELING